MNWLIQTVTQKPGDKISSRNSMRHLLTMVRGRPWSIPRNLIALMRLLDMLCCSNRPENGNKMNTARHEQPKKKIPWLKLASIMKSLLPEQGDIPETNLPFLQTEKGSPRKESTRMGEEGTPRNQS